MENDEGTDLGSDRARAAGAGGALVATAEAGIEVKLRAPAAVLAALVVVGATLRWRHIVSRQPRWSRLSLLMAAATIGMAWTEGMTAGYLVQLQWAASVPTTTPEWSAWLVAHLLKVGVFALPVAVIVGWAESEVRSHTVVS